MPAAPHVETAGRHLVHDVLTAAPHETMATIRARLVEGTRYEQGTVYVVDQGRLVGFVSLPELLVAGDDAIARHMRPLVAVARPEDDQERVARLAVRHRLAAVPVVDHDGRLLGIVPAVALITILHHEHVEDLHRLAGIERENAFAHEATGATPARRARHRLPWLLVGLVGSMLATFVVSRFEGELAADMRLAFFMPGIVYVADAIGTQTEAVSVRALSLGHRGLAGMLWGEVGTGLIIGLVLGGLAGPAAAVAFQDPGIGLAVGLSVLMAGTSATTMGLVLPWVLDRAGVDPAFGAGPLATIIQDLLTIVIFFLVAGLVV